MLENVFLVILKKYDLIKSGIYVPHSFFLWQVLSQMAW